jgi:hypothetical protein
MASSERAVTDPGKRPGFLLLVVAAVFASASTAAGQVVVPPNSHVRFQVGAGDSVHEALLSDVRPDSIFFIGCADCEKLAFALGEVTHLDVRTRPPGSVAGNVLGGTLAGFLVGGVVGAVAGIEHDRYLCKSSETNWCLGPAVGIILGAPTGAIVGGVTGAHRMRERWVNVIPGHV